MALSRDFRARLVRITDLVLSCCCFERLGSLEPGMQFTGPAVIESKGTTVLVHPNNQVSLDDYGNIHIHLRTGEPA